MRAQSRAPPAPALTRWRRWPRPHTSAERAHAPAQGAPRGCRSRSLTTTPVWPACRTRRRRPRARSRPPTDLADEAAGFVELLGEPERPALGCSQARARLSLAVVRVREPPVEVGPVAGIDHTRLDELVPVVIPVCFVELVLVSDPLLPELDVGVEEDRPAGPNVAGRDEPEVEVGSNGPAGEIQQFRELLQRERRAVEHPGLPERVAGGRWPAQQRCRPCWDAETSGERGPMRAAHSSRTASSRATNTNGAPRSDSESAGNPYRRPA